MLIESGALLAKFLRKRDSGKQLGRAMQCSAVQDKVKQAWFWCLAEVASLLPEAISKATRLI